MLNRDHQGHSSDQNKNRSITPRNREKTITSDEESTIEHQLAQGSYNHILEADCIRTKVLSQCTLEIAFNHHQNTQVINHIKQWKSTSNYDIYNNKYIM